MRLGKILAGNRKVIKVTVNGLPTLFTVIGNNEIQLDRKIGGRFKYWHSNKRNNSNLS